ncbi:hypothetical protein B1810_10920 [Panacagrimonas perspica]|nr:hypothetical protein B1810_10920 [Panacagrimonas perspica]
MRRPAPSTKSDKAPPKAGAADRALPAAAEDSALQAAIDGRDVQAVARLVVAGTSTRVRQSAAHAIDDPDVLRQLIRDTRGGNDKGVYKILTSKRDLLIEQTRKFEQLQAQITAASRDLERHSQRGYDASYGATLDQFESHWETVAEHADTQLRGSVQQWIDRSRQVIAEHLHQAAAQAARELAAANEAAEAQRLREQQRQASAAAAAEQQQVLEEQNRARAEKQQAEQQALRQIGELIRKARGALNVGSSSRAASVRRSIEENLAGAPPLPAALASQLQQLDKQLDELKDWKSFSVTPKRAELIEEMESLVGETLDPPELAERIKSLQEEWRNLGKDAGENLEADAQRFKEAGRKAYQPCAEYFAAQALILEENLRRRDALLDKLAAFEAGYPWEQADWRTVISTLRETKEAWRLCSPVDRRAGKQQQENFVAVTARLQSRVDAEHARNLNQKALLIERSRQLLASDDVRKAIEGIKKLQQEWQGVGPVPREMDQRLWGEFRQHCDAVFQKRQQESATHTAGLENNKAQAVALCEQLEKLAALEPPAVLERAALVDLRTAFEAIGEFPRADTRELLSRFDRGLKRCEAAIASQHARAAERGWSDLFEAANLVRTYRLAMARSEETAQLDTLKRNAETCIASAQRWPRNGLSALKQALAGERSEDLVANETALRLLCIRAEILTDTPTPPEDQTLRRDYQLQRLVQNMGQGARADEANLDAMAIEWVGVGPVEEAAYQPLLQRFRRCRERGNSRAP